MLASKPNGMYCKVENVPTISLHHAAAGIPLDRSSASIDLPAKPSAAAERRSFKASPAAAASRAAATDKQQQRNAKATELQAQLSLVQEELRSAREHLASVEDERAQVLEDMVLARRLAADASGKLEESLAARRRAEEVLELERFESTEREHSAIDAVRRAEDEWRRKYDGIKKRHTEDVTALIAATRELDDRFKGKI